MNRNAPHIGLALVLAVLLLLLTDPFMYWMPEAMAMTILVVVASLLALWAGLIAREGGGDERDAHHRMLAGRAGYLAGIALLTIALIYQGFTHTLDIWVPLTLGAMILAKVGARVYGDYYL